MRTSCVGKMSSYIKQGGPEQRCQQSHSMYVMCCEMLLLTPAPGERHTM